MKQKKGKFDENSYCMLLKKCKEKLLCDFCDKTFDSRYSNIIHNGHHIVIPLLKQKLHQCEECLCYFQTVNELVKHLLEKHNRVTPQQARNKQGCNASSANSNKEYEIVNISNEVQSRKTDIKEVLQSFSSLGKLSVTKKIEREETPLAMSLKGKSNINNVNIKDEKIYNTWNVAIDKKVTGYNLCDSMIDIKSEEYILPDVYYDIKISPNTNSTFDNALSSIKNSKSRSSASHALNKNDCQILPNLNEERFLSVHYNDLTQPCKYKCKLCQNVNMFPNRYALTLHQISHLEISDIQPSFCNVCDKYFSSNDLKSHMKEKHWNIKTNCNLMTCVICNFKCGSYKKHLFDYHHNLFSWGPETKMWKKMCYGNFTFKNVYHFSNESDSDVVELCPNCFTNITISKTKCRIISTCKKKGYLLKCSRCQEQFLEINFVEKLKPIFVSKFKFEEDVKKRKKKTNKERLKKIQMRLKMINKLSRFYVWFHFNLSILPCKIG